MIDMPDRIRTADLVSLGFAYMAHAGLPWLSWPLPAVGTDHATWLRWVVAAVATAPVCNRTEADCYAELRRIDHAGLARTLATIATEGA